MIGNCAEWFFQSLETRRGLRPFRKSSSMFFSRTKTLDTEGAATALLNVVRQHTIEMSDFLLDGGPSLNLRQCLDLTSECSAFSYFVVDISLFDSYADDNLRDVLLKHFVKYLQQAQPRQNWASEIQHRLDDYASIVKNHHNKLDGLPECAVEACKKYGAMDIAYVLSNQNDPDQDTGGIFTIQKFAARASAFSQGATICLAIAIRAIFSRIEANAFPTSLEEDILNQIRDLMRQNNKHGEVKLQ